MAAKAATHDNPPRPSVATKARSPTHRPCKRRFVVGGRLRGHDEFLMIFMLILAPMREGNRDVKQHF
jgi:hypothetical protein